MKASRFFSAVVPLFLALTPALGPLTATAHAQRPVAAPDERAVSVGRWDVVSVEYSGRTVAPELVAMLQVDYRADGSWAVLFKGLTVAEGTSTNRQDDFPKTFEMATLGSKSIEPARYTGIYRHDGDTRVLCFVLDGKPRPDAFTAPKRSGRTLVTLKRPRRP